MTEDGLQSQISERDEQTMREVQCLTATVAWQQAKMEKMQVDAMEDAKAVNDCLKQAHAIVADLVKKSANDDDGRRLDRL